MFFLSHIPYFLDCKTHFPPKIWEENGGASYRTNVAYLACGGARRGGSRGGAGSPLQEAGSGRSGAMLWVLGWEEGVSPWYKKQGRQEQSPHCGIL